MEYMGTKQASEKWGYSQGTISNWCKNGLIKDVEQDKKVHFPLKKLSHTSPLNYKPRIAQFLRNTRYLNLYFT